jgi:hypothetical protein
MNRASRLWIWGRDPQRSLPIVCGTSDVIPCDGVDDCIRGRQRSDDEGGDILRRADDEVEDSYDERWYVLQ